MVKMERNSRQKEQEETRRQFRSGLIKQILELTVPKIVKNTIGREASMRDLAEVMRPVMDQYQDSEMTRKMLGAVDFEEWDRFFDEVVRIVARQVRQEKQKNISKEAIPHKSQGLKQKNLF
jgi:hypothetical protein